MEAAASGVSKSRGGNKAYDTLMLKCYAKLFQHDFCAVNWKHLQSQLVKDFKNSKEIAN